MIDHRHRKQGHFRALYGLSARCVAAPRNCILHGTSLGICNNNIRQAIYI
nr:MAG TPA: hypothetical protein [Caudoviricetes sp.]